MSNIPSDKNLIAFIKGKLQTDPKWAIRALTLIHKNQTEDEKRELQTKHYNGIGFNGFDAAFLTSLVDNLTQYGSLKPKQMSALHKSIAKYAGQVLTCGDRNKILKQYNESILV